MQFSADYRHQRGNTEPTEEAQKKREPRHVESTHGGAMKVTETDLSGFVANNHEEAFSFGGNSGLASGDLHGFDAGVEAQHYDAVDHFHWKSPHLRQTLYARLGDQPGFETNPPVMQPARDRGSADH